MIIKGYKIVQINISNYFNNNLAIEFECLDEEFNIPEPFAVITKNLEDNLEPNEAYIDANNCPWIVDILDSYKLAKPTGEVFLSGFVEYPKYKFNLDKIRKLNEELDNGQ